MNFKNTWTQPVLYQLFEHGPTWDGDINSKEGIDELLDLGLAVRIDKWSTLTALGLELALKSRGFVKKKNRFDDQVYLKVEKPKIEAFQKVYEV